MMCIRIRLSVCNLILSVCTATTVVIYENKVPCAQYILRAVCTGCLWLYFGFKFIAAEISLGCLNRD